MKSIIAAVFLILGPYAAHAGEIILPYSAFGPQVLAHKLIGMEWWQWDSHGDSRPREYPIKVVVFWDQTLADTAKKYPVDRGKLKDFRYVEYSKAAAYFARTIKTFKEAKLDASPLELGMAKLHQQRAAEAKGKR